MSTDIGVLGYKIIIVNLNKDISLFGPIQVSCRQNAPSSMSFSYNISCRICSLSILAFKL